MEKSNKYIFLGVSTHNSLINSTFPLWMDHISADVVLNGFNLPLGANASEYVNFVDNLNDDRICGCLITSHKTRIYECCKEQFFNISDEATELKEISSIKRDSVTGKLFAHNTDIIASRRSLMQLTAYNPLWMNGDGNITILGAGGACLSLVKAIDRYLEFSGTIRITEKYPERIRTVMPILKKIDLDIIVEEYSNTLDVIESSGRAPLLVNATGVGKDIAGTPISDIGCIGANTTVWELNYRGDLQLLSDLADSASKKLIVINDGWDFFVDGWMNNICFTLSISPTEVLSSQFQHIAASFKPSKI